MLEFDSRIFSLELSINPLLLLIPIRMPFLQLGVEYLKTVNSTPAKTLLCHGCQLYLGNVKPTSVLWRVMKLKAP